MNLSDFFVAMVCTSFHEICGFHHIYVVSIIYIYVCVPF
jgi:hypothetical protein